MTARGRVLSVGNKEPVLASLREHRPDYVLCVVSTGEGGSKSVLEYEVLPELPSEYRPEVEEVEVTDPDNILTTYGEVRGHIQEWRARHSLRRRDVDVDFTGGTKVMSVALGLIAVEEGVDTAYVGGGERAADGRVITGQEEVIAIPNPYRVFAVKELGDAEELLNSYHADAAAQVLRRGQSICATIYQGTLNAYFRLANSLARADLFEFNAQAGALYEFRACRSRVVTLLADSLYGEMEGMYSHWEELGSDTARANETAGRSTLLELLANAERRAKQARYDDAVARLYRAAELRGQQLLKEAFGGELGRVPLAGLASQERRRFESLDARPRNGIYEIRGVANLFSTLRFSSNGDIRAAAARYDILKEFMDYRNHSLLAHGLSPVTEGQFAKFWRAALLALDVSDSEIPRWPVFTLPLEGSE